MHTKGPWFYNFDPDICEPAVWGGSAKAICDVSCEDIEDQEEVWSNARLIAAAPDLLAACEAMIVALGEQRTLYSFEEMANKAIKKAKGDQP